MGKMGAGTSASMGPRRCRRGKVNLFDCLLGLVGALQWGHDDVVVEGGQPMSDFTKDELLQWGHDDGVVEG